MKPWHSPPFPKLANDAMSDRSFYKTERMSDLRTSLADAKSEIRELERDLDENGGGGKKLTSSERNNIRSLLTKAKADLKLIENEIASRQ